MVACRTRRSWFAALGLGGAAACSAAACGAVPAFACDQDQQCRDGAVAGTCELGGCAFPDDACPSGKRYGKHSGETGGQCVPPSQADGNATSGPTTVDPDTNADPDTTTAVSAGDTTAGVAGSDSGSTTQGPAESSGGTDTGNVDTGTTAGELETVHNYVFVTSMTVVAGNLGGLDGADGVCQDAAENAGVVGTFVAWLSTSTIDARDRLGGAQGWARVDGRPFARSVDALVNNELLYPARLDENGVDIGGQSVVTATDAAGAYIEPSDCTDYSANNGPGAFFVRRGNIDALGSAFTDWFDAPCGGDTHLLCLGVDDAVALPVALTPTGRRAFVSSQSLDASVGLAAFDAQCQSDADASGLAGTFSAFVATNLASAASRFNLGGEPWSLVNDVQIVEQAAAIADDGLLLAPIWLDAAGNSASSGSVWTGGLSPDVAGTESGTCADWSSDTGESIIGRRVRTVGWWNAASGEACDTVRRVYCLQQ